MASADTFGDSSFGAAVGGSSSLDGLPAFVTSGSVDDKKYESLLAELRAHDLLGPLDVDVADAFDSSSNAGGGMIGGVGAGGSSLFFNDASSAVFMGSFSESKSLFPETTAAPSSRCRAIPGSLRSTLGAEVA